MALASEDTVKSILDFAAEVIGGEAALHVTLDASAGVSEVSCEQLPASLGPTTPSGSTSVAGAQSTPVTWRVPVTTTPRRLLIAWQAATAYTLGEAVTNDSGKVYVCRTAGTSAGSGGPTGTGADITDNTAHWSYAAASATAFKGSMVLRNLEGSGSAVCYSGLEHTTKGGQQLPAGQGEPVYCADATAVYVATESGTATASVAAYP